MEQKRQEMLDAIKNNQLDEWLASGPIDQNHNVYAYYEAYAESEVDDEVFFLCAVGDKLVDGVCIVSNPQPVYGLDCEVLYIWNYAIDDCNFRINSINFIFSLLLPISIAIIIPILIALKYKKRF